MSTHRKSKDVAIVVEGVRYDPTIVQRAIAFWFSTPTEFRPAPAEPFGAWWARQTQSLTAAAPPVPIPAQRQPIYGHPALNFARNAILWSGLLANKLLKPITSQEVAIMMAGVKLARLIESPAHQDSIDDVGGYMSCLEQVNAVAEAGTDGSGIHSETVAQARAQRKD